jgi:nitrate reductase alpha subunit
MYETQQTDYPRTRDGIPNHEPRGCQRGASCSWYIYHTGRLRYPMVRRALLEPWRDARAKASSAVEAWAAMVDIPEIRRDWVAKRGKGGFLRSSWDEVNEIISAAHVHTARTHGPDRISGFAPIPAYSMVSYGAGTRYLSLIGGTCLSFYDWYADLPPSSPQTWGEQTDVPESSAWFGAGFLILWGSNVAQTRSPDAHFFSEARYHGAKSVVITPDYSDTSKFADLWMHPRQGTDAALAMAMGHVIFTEFHVRRPEPYFLDYCSCSSDMPILVRLERRGEHWVPGRYVRASDFPGALGQASKAEWKPVARDAGSGRVVVPVGSIGFRWGEDGRWNLEPKDAATGEEVTLELSQIERRDEVAIVAFPYFSGAKNSNTLFGRTDHPNVLLRGVPATRVHLADGEALVATVYDLMLANYGVDRGLGGAHVATGYDDHAPYTPAWQEGITGVPRRDAIAVAREFAETAARTRGKSMILLGAATNHWFHGDMTYRAIIAILIGCGTVGRPNGGFAHYVGQECIRPEEGWATFSFALDWQKPPRQVPGTTYFYTHTDQWRYESVTIGDLLSPTAPAGPWSGALIDYGARAERMGWSGTAALDSRNPLDVAREIEASGEAPGDFVARRLKSGALRFASMDPDAPGNWPRAMIVWRSNLFGASGKGHEYFLKHLVGAVNHGVQGDETARGAGARPEEVVWRDEAPVGKLDLLVTIDFRMSSTALYSDIVLPTATWYEKNDVATTDMHPFVHPLGEAISPVWEARSDWDIFKGLAKAFDAQSAGILGPCKDVVIAPLAHDTPGELAQPFEPSDWGRGEVDPVPGQSMGRVVLVERDYGNIHTRFTALGPNVREAVEGKGIEWPSAPEYELLQGITGKVETAGHAKGAPRIETDIDAVETVLALSSATNGQVSLRAFEALSKKTGRDHTHFVGARAAERIRYHDIVAQPRKAITTPTWSGLMNEEVS